MFLGELLPVSLAFTSSRSAFRARSIVASLSDPAVVNPTGIQALCEGPQRQRRSPVAPLVLRRWARWLSDRVNLGGYRAGSKLTAKARQAAASLSRPPMLPWCAARARGEARQTADRRGQARSPEPRRSAERRPVAPDAGGQGAGEAGVVSRNGGASTRRVRSTPPAAPG
jgi:hypothetical protein